MDYVLLFGILWWLSGVSALLTMWWLDEKKEELTLGSAIGILFGGFGGLFFWAIMIIMALVIISQQDFWRKTVIYKKGSRR